MKLSLPRMFMMLWPVGMIGSALDLPSCRINNPLQELLHWNDGRSTMRSVLLSGLAALPGETQRDASEAQT